MHMRKQLTSCYWWITLLIPPYHSTLAQIPLIPHFLYSILLSDLRPALINSAKAMITGKGTSLMMQSLTCSSQEPGAHWLPQTQQLISLVHQSVQWSLRLSKPLSWKKTVLAEFKETRQNKLPCLLCWSISSCIISTSRCDQLNLCFCNQPCNCVAPSLTE